MDEREREVQRRRAVELTDRELIGAVIGVLTKHNWSGNGVAPIAGSTFHKAARNSVTL